MSQPEAERFIGELRGILEQNPSATNDELAKLTGRSLPTIRKYRKIVQGCSSPGRTRRRFMRVDEPNRKGKTVLQPEIVVPVPALDETGAFRVDVDETVYHDQGDVSGGELHFQPRISLIAAHRDPPMASESDRRWEQMQALESIWRTLWGDEGVDPRVNLLRQYAVFLDAEDLREGRPISDASPLKRRN